MALFEVNESNGIPIWVQLRNRFVYLIDSGHYQNGDQLPTVRALAAELEINYHTVNKVYTSLEHENYITTKRGKGAFVSKTGEVGEGKPTAAIVIEECIRQCLELGMSASEIQIQFDRAIESIDR